VIDAVERAIALDATTRTITIDDVKSEMLLDAVTRQIEVDQ
jgi:hypothetical protein